MPFYLSAATLTAPEIVGVIALALFIVTHLQVLLRLLGLIVVVSILFTAFAVFEATGQGDAALSRSVVAAR